jgi:protein SSD1
VSLNRLQTGSYSRAVSSTPPQPSHAGPTPSEGEKKLQSLLGDLRSQASGPAASSTSPGHGGTEQSIHNPNRHRKNNSGSQSSFLSPVNVPPQSGLNPQAGGFQPGGLGSLAEVQNEVLLTPTVPNFDPSISGGMNPNSSFTFPPPAQQAQQAQQVCHILVAEHVARH